MGAESVEGRGDRDGRRPAASSTTASSSAIASESCARGRLPWRRAGRGTCPAPARQVDLGPDAPDGQRAHLPGIAGHRHRLGGLEVQQRAVPRRSSLDPRGGVTGSPRPAHGRPVEQLRGLDRLVLARGASSRLVSSSSHSPVNNRAEERLTRARSPQRADPAAWAASMASCPRGRSGPGPRAASPRTGWRAPGPGAGDRAPRGPGWQPRRRSESQRAAARRSA